MTYKVFLWNFNEPKDIFVEIVFNIQATGPKDETGYLYSCERLTLEQDGSRSHSMGNYDEDYEEYRGRDQCVLSGIYETLHDAIRLSTALLKIQS